MILLHLIHTTNLYIEYYHHLQMRKIHLEELNYLTKNTPVSGREGNKNQISDFQQVSCNLDINCSCWFSFLYMFSSQLGSFSSGGSKKVNMGQDLCCMVLLATATAYRTYFLKYRERKSNSFI